MKSLFEYLGTKNLSVDPKFVSTAPFKHWKEAWWKFHHNQYKFNHDIQRWHDGEVTFNIKIWKDEKLVVAYKYCMNNRFEEECKKLQDEATRRGWDMTAINFNTKDWNPNIKE